jgi:hypothetical protein
MLGGSALASAATALLAPTRAGLAIAEMALCYKGSCSLLRLPMKWLIAVESLLAAGHGGLAQVVPSLLGAKWTLYPATQPKSDVGAVLCLSLS